MILQKAALLMKLLPDINLILIFITYTICSLSFYYWVFDCIELTSKNSQIDKIWAGTIFLELPANISSSCKEPCENHWIMCGFGLLNPFVSRDQLCCRGNVITHQVESVSVSALLTFPVASLLAFAVNQKQHGMVAARNMGKSINALDGSAIVSSLKEIQANPLYNCKWPFNINAVALSTQMQIRETWMCI